MTSELQAAANEIEDKEPVKTLRDEMAMAALFPLVNNWVNPPQDINLDGPTLPEIAEDAYRIADAMMKQRKVK